MKSHTSLFVVASMVFLLASPLSVKAADFDWAVDLNLRSNTDPMRYNSQVGLRFGMGEVRVREIIRRVERPSDAYIILRLSEMTSRSPEYIMKRYKEKKYQGWGDFAHSLGIKPGSADFKALKSGHDIRDYDRRDRHDDYDKKDNRNKKDKHHKNNGKN